MYQYIYDQLILAEAARFASPIASAILFLAAAAVALILRLLLRLIISLMIRQMKKRTHGHWPDALLHSKIPQRLSNLVLPVVLLLLAGQTPHMLILRAVGILSVIVFALLLNAVIAAINKIYETYEVSKTRPLRGLLQVVQVAILILCGVAALSILLGQNPFLMVGSIGAVTAVVSFIFKDPILGFVAGIQLTANNMLRIGDWIEMPKHSLDGDVVEISMTTVKVRNFDQTITSIPAQALVNDAFVNWRGMQEAGGRRIKRSIHINATHVRLCDDEMIDRFQRISLIEDYMKEKRTEIEAYNQTRASDPGVPLNVRQLTNLGTFRAYMAAYLKAHPGIHHDMTTMVRQLAPDDKGIPLEVYAFTATTEWEPYEGIQADIFDHFFSAVGIFGLETYQSPSGTDFRRDHVADS